MLKPSMRTVGALFPIWRWSRNYSMSGAAGDCIAGVTVALTLVPQSIAYAALAGLEPQYGLYASYVGGVVYAFLGTCPQINIGPSALLSLLTFTYTSGTNPDFAILLCFIGGIVQIFAGVVRLGFLVEYVSLPVVSGFTSAAAITIASSQIKGLLGLRFSSESFTSTWLGVFQHIGDIRLPDALLSIVCCIILTGMKMLKDMKLKIPQDDKKRKSAIFVNKFFWFFGVSRNAVVVVLATAAAYFVHNTKDDPIILTGDITPGIPMPKPPAFSTTVGNTTYTGTEMLAHLGSGLVVVPLIGIIANVAIAKAFAKGKSLDATQEIIALGVCNVVGAFFSSFPVNGSFSRSAVSDASGVRSPAAGLYTGFIVILTLLLLTPYFYFIPRATLASVIICAVLHMVDIDIVRKLWKTSKADLIPLFGTFLLCLALGIVVGLICGVVIDAILLMYHQSRPALDIHFVNDGVLQPHYAIHPIASLHFAAAERVRSQLLALRHSKMPTHTISTHPRITNSPMNGVTPVNETTTIPYTTNEGNGGLRTNGNLTRTNGDLNGVPLQITVNTGSFAPCVEAKHRTILVVYCRSLNFMDYTFLQSIKSLLTEWSRDGVVVWCDVTSAVKRQLDEVLEEPACYCESQQLRNLLTLTEENARIADTHL